jgi:hypothetical protein
VTNIIPISTRKDEPKRKRKEPTSLKGFDVTIATGAEDNNRTVDEKTYWKTSVFFTILIVVDLMHKENNGNKKKSILALQC